MLFKFLLAFTLIPLFELWFLLWVGRQIGIWPTIGLVVATGAAGAYLAKSQGLSLLYRIRIKMIEGEVPSDEMLQGAFILAGGIMLLTPGLFTDLFGFSLLLPFSRIIIKRWLERKIRIWMQQGHVTVWRM